MTKVHTLAVLCALLFAVTAPAVEADTIVGIAQGNEDFSSLTEAVVAADLVETLASEGPFTVFAPVNEAFAALPAYIIRTLAQNPALLSDILLYHVVPQNLTSSAVVSMSTIATAGGEEVKISARDGKYYVNDATITAVDIEADNGTIHVIDTVLIPNSVYAVALASIKEELEAIKALLEIRQINNY